MKELIHFSASWCQPCKKMAPMIDKFVEDNTDIVYSKYDADLNVSVFEEYGVRGVPTFITKIDGEIHKYHNGVASQEQISDLFA